MSKIEYVNEIIFSKLTFLYLMIKCNTFMNFSMVFFDLIEIYE